MCVLVCIDMCVHACTCTYVCTHVCQNAHACACMPACMYMCVCICVRICAHVCTFVCTCTCTCTCVHVRMYAHACPACVYIYTQINSENDVNKLYITECEMYTKHELTLTSGNCRKTEAACSTSAA